MRIKQGFYGLLCLYVCVHCVTKNIWTFLQHRSQRTDTNMDKLKSLFVCSQLKVEGNTWFVRRRSLVWIPGKSLDLFFLSNVCQSFTEQPSVCRFNSSAATDWAALSVVMSQHFLEILTVKTVKLNTARFCFYKIQQLQFEVFECCCHLPSRSVRHSTQTQVLKVFCCREEHITPR